ncbi:Ldh family oxidoreductase [Rhodobacteraceae bacterium 2CG4]|uniref:Ldh family oxidoreductase n=1 Tax=Halovulum marinum TaxID=2662447 RepID=A0A6L5Z1Q8_9RHOB|nr:Ldh family oxidoreductase [Halovulum marinum]MSU90438.1 Ldh family oxidoreductase [Halovulum marinum]
MADAIRLPIAEAEDLVALALRANAVSPANAATVARALVAAEVDGQGGHGFSRVASYAAQARSGKVDGNATPTVERAAAALLTVDAGHGFAFPAIDAAIEQLARLTPETGIAGAAVRRSHHCGQLGAHVERLAGHGLAALMVGNSPKAMAPWGGASALLGTNPIAFAAPRGAGEAPLVIDLSLSKVARGKVLAAAKAGRPIPEGWALDADGHPTTDPQAALRGTMIPMGDAKGAALALVVEILSATLTAANHSHEASSFFDAEGDPPGVGQLIVAFDVSRASGGSFAGRIEQLLGEIAAQGGARIPGTRRLAARAACRRDGVAVPAHLLAEITALGDN